jgi:hypothetical protein
MRRVAVLLAIAAVAIPVTSAVADQNQPAADAVSAAVQARLQTTSPVFANCPTQNTLPQPDGSTAQNCELRVVVGTNVITGVAVAKAAGASYQVTDLFLSAPVPNDWQKCSRRAGGGRNNGQTPRLVKVHGLACGAIKLLAGDIRQLPLQGNLRLPPQFPVTGHGTNTIGFVIASYSCTGKTRVVQGFNPFGVLTARCFNGFGDGFVYKFTQSS